MKEAKETFYSPERKQMEHLFYGQRQKEIKELWYEGNCIYKLHASEMVEITVPPGAYGDDVVEIGDYIVLYQTSTVSSTGYKVHRFKDKQYVDSITVCEKPEGYSGPVIYTAREFRNRDFIYIAEVLSDNSQRVTVPFCTRIFTYTASGVSTLEIPEDMRYYTRLSMDRCTLAGNRLFFYDMWFPKYDVSAPISRDEWLAGSNFFVTATLDSAGWLGMFEVTQRAGANVDPTTEGRYALSAPIIDNVLQDRVTGRYYGEAITAIVYKRLTQTSSPRRYYEIGWCELTLDGVSATVLQPIGLTSERTLDDGYWPYRGNSAYTRTPVGDFSYIYQGLGWEQQRPTSSSPYYHTLLRDYHLYIEYLAQAITYTDAQAAFVAFPVAFACHDRATDLYYGIAAAGSYEGYHDGFYTTEHPDTGGLYYQQAFDWEQILEQPYSPVRYNNINAADVNNDGVYVCSGSRIFHFSK